MPDFETLRNYYPFDEDIVRSVEAAADSQDGQGYETLAADYGTKDGWVYSELFEHHRSHRGREHRGVALRRVGMSSLPSTPGHARVLFAPFALPPDQNVTMRAIRTVETIGDEVPMLVVGAPSMRNHMSDRLDRHERRTVRAGNFGPLTVPILNYLHSQNITHVDMLGYSYGADVAAQAAADAHDYDIEVKKAVLIEPAAVLRRRVGSLAMSFLRAGARLDEYVKEADSPVLNEARELADEGLVRYIGALLRPTNVAIVRSLAMGGFITRVSEALHTQRDLRVTIGWGTDSELSAPDALAVQTNGLRTLYSPGRVTALPLAGMPLAGADNINLHAAMMAQGLRLASKASD